MKNSITTQIVWAPALLLTGLLALLALSPAALAQLAPNPDFLSGASSHTYKSVDGVTLRLHVFSPHAEQAENRPATIFFFGGGWRQGRIQQFVPHAEHLASRGMVAIIADYRVAFRHGADVAAAVSDAKSAIRWIRSNAQSLGIDPDRIVAAGGSAGGHLAAATATVPGFESANEDLSISSKPNALALFNPAINTAGVGERRPQQFAGNGEALSPHHQLKDASVPTIIVHGKADTTVPYELVVGYCEKLTRLDGHCELHGYEEATHGFFNKGRDNDRWYTPTLQEVDAFLTELDYLPE